MELLGIAERQAKSMVEKREKSTATVTKTKKYKPIDDLDGALALLDVDKSKTFSQEIRFERFHEILGQYDTSDEGHSKGN